MRMGRLIHQPKYKSLTDNSQARSLQAEHSNSSSIMIKMSTGRNNLEVIDLADTRRHDAIENRFAAKGTSGEEYGFHNEINGGGGNPSSLKKRYVLKSPSNRNNRSNRHTSPHLQQKKSLQPINITYKEEEAGGHQSELQKLRQTVKFLTKRLQERGESPRFQHSQEKLMQTQIAWLKKSLKQQQQKNEILTQQLDHRGLRRVDSSSNRKGISESQKRPNDEQILSNNLKIAKIQQEMQNMREDVTRLKDVIIDQRVYISELETQLGVLRELQGSRVGTSGWPYLQQKSVAYQTYQRQSTLKSKSDSSRNLSQPQPH